MQNDAYPIRLELFSVFLGNQATSRSRLTKMWTQKPFCGRPTTHPSRKGNLRNLLQNTAQSFVAFLFALLSTQKRCSDPLPFTVMFPENYRAPVGL